MFEQCILESQTFAKNSQMLITDRVPSVYHPYTNKNDCAIETQNSYLQNKQASFGEIMWFVQLVLFAIVWELISMIPISCLSILHFHPKIPSQLDKRKASLSNETNRTKFSLSVFRGKLPLPLWQAPFCWSPPCPKDRHPNQRRTAPALPGSPFVTVSEEMRRSTSHRCSWDPNDAWPNDSWPSPLFGCWLVMFFNKKPGEIHGLLKIGRKKMYSKNPEGPSFDSKKHTIKRHP